VRLTEAGPAEPTAPQKADDIAQLKKRRKTSPGSTAQPETSRANSTAPRLVPAQPETPRPPNPSPCTARTLTIAAIAGERERGSSSSTATPTYVVEDHAPLKVPRVGIRPRNRNPERVDSDLQRPNQSLPHRRTEPESTVSSLQAETSRKAETNRTADTSHTVETKGEGKKRLVGSGVMATQEDEQRPTSKATVSGELGEQERQLAVVIQQTRRPILTLSSEVSR
jgi:hypothetical protein